MKPSYDRIPSKSNKKSMTEYAVHGDHLKENQMKDVESLLSSELMRLSINDRNAIEEEIHGVHCLAPEETPQLLDVSLRQLLVVLNNLPSDISAGYRQSQRFPNTYVNTADFLLRFLRCELFDVQKAAMRVAHFLNLCTEYFGVYALQRPVMLSDFNKDELKCFRRGRLQWLPFRDRSGRRVAILFPGKEYFTIPEKVRVRALDAMGRNICGHEYVTFQSFDSLYYIFRMNRFVHIFKSTMCR